jgi:cyanophycinase
MAQKVAKKQWFLRPKWVFAGGGILVVLALLLRHEIQRQVTRLLHPRNVAAQVSEGMLVICGGGDVPPAARRKFMELAGGQDAKMVIIPGGEEDESSFSSYFDVWKEYEPLTFHMLNASSRDQANDPDFTSILDEATGVWLGGGQQDWLISRYANTLVENKLHELLKRKGVIGGTSAGAAVMSAVMVAGGGRKNPQVGKGFGFMPGVVVDQHFLKRNRFLRLRSVLDIHTGLIGLGVDEQTAMVYSIAADSLEIVGDSYVVACIPRNNRLDIEFLQAGDEIRLSDLRAEEDSSFSSTIRQVLFE